MIRALTPLAHVASVARSIEFYCKLGFELRNTFTPPGNDEPSWAWLQSADAHLMLARASHSVDATQQAILFYVYCDDIDATHAKFAAAGIDPGPIEKPFYSPHGEFRVTDPDGYGLTFAHT